MLMDVCYLFTPARPEAGAQHLTQASLLKSFRLWVLVPGPGTQIKSTECLQVCCHGSGHALTEYHCLSDLGLILVVIIPEHLLAMWILY